MSPFCPGKTLAACPSPAAARLRDEIAERIAAGETPAAIVETLVDRFGDHIRGSPAPQGIGLTLWLVPGSLGMLLLAVLLGSARSGRLGSRPEASTAPVPLEGAWQARLDEELERLG